LLSDSYRKEPQDIYDKADAELKEIWSNRPDSQPLNLRNKYIPHTTDWEKLAKALKPFLGEGRYPVRKEFRHALERIAPALPALSARSSRRPETWLDH